MKYRLSRHNWPLRSANCSPRASQGDAAGNHESVKAVLLKTLWDWTEHKHLYSTLHSISWNRILCWRSHVRVLCYHEWKKNLTHRARQFLTDTQRGDRNKTEILTASITHIFILDEGKFSQFCAILFLSLQNCIEFYEYF